MTNKVLKKLKENLDMLMHKDRLSANELAKLVNLPATTIKRIRSDEDANPTLASLQPIAQHFSISISELIGDSPINTERAKNIKNELQTIPLLSWSECAHFELLDYNKCPAKIITEKKLSEKTFAVSIENSEFDTFQKGAILIVEPDIKPNSGDYIIYTKINQTTPSIKKFIVDDDQAYLKSLVAGLSITPFTNDFKILGVILQYRYDFRI